jgi:hypothetical protein
MEAERPRKGNLYELYASTGAVSPGSSPNMDSVKRSLPFSVQSLHVVQLKSLLYRRPTCKNHGLSRREVYYAPSTRKLPDEQNFANIELC